MKILSIDTKGVVIILRSAKLYEHRVQPIIKVN